MRVAAFVDGFNLYHAIHDLKRPHLKWVDLRQLVETFAPAPTHILTKVVYCSAFATWRPDAYRRHREFVKASEARGVTTIMGKFKEKARECLKCGSRWKGHEEKESDVNLALQLLDAAHQDLFDRAILISGDSDLVPAVRMVRAHYPAKQIRILMPPGRPYSMDLVNAAGGTNEARRIEVLHLERALLPAEVVEPLTGKVVARRPSEYQPPPDLRSARRSASPLLPQVPEPVLPSRHPTFQKLGDLINDLRRTLGAGPIGSERAGMGFEQRAELHRQCVVRDIPVGHLLVPGEVLGQEEIMLVPVGPRRAAVIETQDRGPRRRVGAEHLGCPRLRIHRARREDEFCRAHLFRSVPHGGLAVAQCVHDRTDARPVLPVARHTEQVGQDIGLHPDPHP